MRTVGLFFGKHHNFFLNRYIYHLTGINYICLKEREAALTSSRPNSHARSSALQPSLCRASTSAPYCSRILHVLQWPYWAARWRGVHPLRAEALQLAPDSSRAATTSTLPWNKSAWSLCGVEVSAFRKRLFCFSDDDVYVLKMSVLGQV